MKASDEVHGAEDGVEECGDTAEDDDAHPKEFYVEEMLAEDNRTGTTLRTNLRKDMK